MGGLTAIQKNLLTQSMQGWGIKYLEAFRGCLNNFIARKEAFLSSKSLFGVPFITLLFNTIDNLVKNGLE